MLSEEEKLRYSRHLLLDGFGEEAQNKLKKSSVLLIGAGGLGCPVGLYLAAAGVGKITLLDFDLVENSNLQRQVAFESDDLGLPKSEVLAAKMRQLNPYIRVQSISERFDASNAEQLMKEHDVLVDGSDNFSTRYLCNDASFLYKKPLIFAAVSRYSGQLSVFNQDDKSPCYRCLFPQEPEEGITANCSEAGVLGALVGVLGTLQAVECLKVLTGVGESLSGKFMTYDMLTAQFNSFKLAKSPNCQLCGDQAKITELIKQDETCSLEEKSALSLEEFKQVYESQKLALLDIRENAEKALFPIPYENLHIPLSELRNRLDELDSEKVYCTLCQYGERSRKAYLTLKKNKIKAYYLDEGMDKLL
ncbi:Dinucleotide-utilizing enzyme involved in molybdopterin and thiamine biosynthesis family 2 [Lentisphaera araneosa HTCC2155]|uniref:Molybdopterin-synthase adenylyltransferase n=1 Tax=Lentisphaera araneosa HTCC2155 TaxID=313628 RepID=A6DNL0_9BACT|nr:HesA/MoeB/ThiF family protein [Lentisphaera araneosa]EDM26669.1 Dinucleotide-utilizing enzyme involved in molybdopterin and thiamine biosynthesis family 2 [Lentisphaera araneosa HTCC2155]